LTEIAKYPKMKLDDPFAKKGMKTWQKWGLTVLLLIAVVAGLWLGNILTRVSPKLNSPLPRYNKVETVVTDTLSVVNDTIAVEEVVVEENVVTE
jgi:hypothetical protein